MSQAVEIERLDPHNRADVAAVSALHEQFLGDSPVARMGPRFLRDCYYSRLLADGLFDCVACRDVAEGRIVAFMSYTDRPTDFMSRGLRRHFFRVAWTIGTTVLRSPGRLKDVLFVMRLMRERREDGDDEVLRRGAGEALSMAVLPEYRGAVPAGGTARLPTRLIELMAADLRERQVSEIAFYVDPSNLAANLLYSSLGCRFDKITHAGLTRHRFVYPVAPRLEAAQ
ncbi:MAG: hypothetical protein ACT4R6_00535 [Gemmatimonadaceae bacterium]